LVAFLLGCSFTFEVALQKAGVPVRHLEEGRNVSMYITNRSCQPAGVFAGPLVVSMRPIPASLIPRAVGVTSRFPLAHGAPVHVADPQAIGISDLDHPVFGDPVSIHEGERPVFWACGVTPQAVAMHAKPELGGSGLRRFCRPRLTRPAASSRGFLTRRWEGRGGSSFMAPPWRPTLSSSRRGRRSP
jgi:uncharacterized protein YcsI (UPF0317 family)